MKRLYLYPAVLLILALYSCTTTQSSKSKDEKNISNGPDLVFTGGPPAMVYKTKQEYDRNVAITLSPDKRKIVGYPHPKDVFYNGKLAVPTRLINGYLLDNRGINENAAFINMTYDEYAKLAEAPSIEALQSMVIDKNPITEMCNCGIRSQFKDETAELNRLIKSNQLTKCKKVK